MHNCTKETWGAGIPTYGRRDSLPQNNDIPGRTGQAAEGAGFLSLFSVSVQPFSLRGDRSQKI
jgi:hypothetical protein